MKESNREIVGEKGPARGKHVESLTRKYQGEVVGGREGEREPLG